MVDVECEVCGKKESVGKQRAESYKTCSMECSSIRRKSLTPLNCECTNCGKKFHLKNSSVKRYKRNMGTFCSKICVTAYKKEWFKGENNHQYGLKDPLNSSFKGDVIEKVNNNNMDLRIYVGLEHPYSDKNGRILYHRYMIEQNYEMFDSKFFVEIEGKKYLSKKYDVHHKNGDHNDNDITNLQPMTKSEHTSLHNKEKTIIRGDKGRIIGVFKQGELLGSPITVREGNTKSKSVVWFIPIVRLPFIFP